jgi:GINS complex subunit 4
MSSSDGGGAVPRFSFGDMALSDEPGRDLAVSGGLGQRGAGFEGDAATAGAGPRGASLGNASAAPVLTDTIAKLRVAMLNEENAPEILQYETEVVESSRGLVGEQEERVDDQEDATDAPLETHLQRMEIDRINHMLRSYFRARIKKIETFVLFIFKDETVFDRLSAGEQKFAIGYMDLVEEHFKKSFLSMLPERLRVLDKDGNVDHATGPHLDKFVFCHVINSIGPYAVSEDASDEPFDLSRGDIVCVRYGGIRELLTSGDVELI